MKLWRPSDVEFLLAALELKPRRTLGQNFLVDANILRLMLDEAAVGRHDTVLEIGAGLGVLTAPLLERAGRVVAVEKDPLLWRHLHDSLGDAAGLALHRADALELDLPALLAREGITRVVSNLPYSAAARILVELAAAPARPQRMVVSVQKEVGERLAAPPGAGAYGVTSVFLQRWYAIRLCRTLGPSCFLPRPRVTSALLRLDRRAEPLGGPGGEEDVFRRLVRYAFSQRRKQLAGLLRHAPAGLRPERAGPETVLEQAGIAPHARPGELAPEAWVRLAETVGRLSN
jgi:16S rRNA (adenine1518-N6/adenine1519-N6)-dimethyltransferase